MKQLKASVARGELINQQFILLLCAGEDINDENMLIFTSSIRGLFFRLPKSMISCEAGTKKWFICNRGDGQNYIRLSLPHKGNFNIADATTRSAKLCFGQVYDISNTKCSVDISPKTRITIDNFKSAYDKYLPECGDLCCVRLTSDSNGELSGSIVSTQEYKPGERKPVPWDSSAERLKEQAPRTIVGAQINMSRERLATLEEKLQRKFSDFAEARKYIAEAYNKASKNNKIIVERYRKDDVLHISVLLEKTVREPSDDPQPPIFVGLKPDNRVEEKDRWYVEFVGSRSRGLHKIFETHIYVENTEKMFKDLKDIALPEKWSNADGSDPFRILRSYFYFTYYYVWATNRLVTSQGNNLMVFNTGLVNYNYNPIYCVMKPTSQSVREQTMRDWQYCGFAASGEGPVGKEITTWIANKDLPPRATYINELSDLLFYSDKEINMDYTHMIIENAERLPLAMFEDLPGTQFRKVAPIIDAITTSKTKREKHEAYNKLRVVMREDNDRILQSIVKQFKDAVSTTKNRVSWNYKTAVPIFYPARFIISLLLPLELTENAKLNHLPDLALVVSSQPSGNYQGETILTLEMAYNDSRIITRPDSDWLTTDNIIDNDDDSDDQDDE